MALNVLIVDDSAVMRAMIIKSLQAAGLDLGEVWEASDGRKGLDALSENWVDIVFADINMPIMDGEEMVTSIRNSREWADLPIIVISTEGSEARVDRLRAAGAEFIHKPFSPETVRDVVLKMTGMSDE